MSRRKTDGFTLIELLVVIAIIAILAAILFPVFAQAREKARSVSCLSNNKQIMLGVKMYDQDYDELTPSCWYYPNPAGGNFTFMDFINPYIKNNQIWMCPDAPKTVATYTTAPCNTITATYIWPLFNPFNYYNWTSGPGSTTSVVMFSGAPVPTGGGAYNYCTPGNPALGQAGICVGAEQVDFPAQATYLMEGYYGTYTTTVANLPFGSACTIGTLWDWTNTSEYRHTAGMNFAFCDGHAKWVQGQNYNTNHSEVTTEVFTGYPESPYMKFH